MSHIQPDPIFNTAEKRLIMLLGQLLFDSLGDAHALSNRPPNHVLLSSEEANEVLEDVKHYVNSRTFLEQAYFTEASLQGDFNDRAREIFLSGRTKRGRTRTMAAKQWDEFQRRLGFGGTPYYRKSVSPMPFSLFQKMERKLLLKAGIKAPIVDVVMSEISRQEENISRIRAQQHSVRYGAIKHAAENILEGLRSTVSSMSVQSISKHQAAGAITLIADSAVMFTTRDWSVAGTLSTMAGALVVTLQPKP